MIGGLLGPVLTNLRTKFMNYRRKFSREYSLQILGIQGAIKKKFTAIVYKLRNIVLIILIPGGSWPDFQNSNCYLNKNKNLMGVNFIKKYQNLVILKSWKKSE